MREKQRLEFGVFSDLVRGWNHVVCVDLLSILIECTRPCTSPRRRRWELCTEPLQFSPEWSHARCGRIRAKQKDTREGRKPQLSAGQDCVHERRGGRRGRRGGGKDTLQPPDASGSCVGGAVVISDADQVRSSPTPHMRLLLGEGRVVAGEEDGDEGSRLIM